MINDLLRIITFLNNDKEQNLTFKKKELLEKSKVFIRILKCL